MEKDLFEQRKAVCRRIILAIKERGWSQKRFAEAWGKPESQVSKLLSGRVDMQLSTLTEIEKILGIEIIRREQR